MSMAMKHHGRLCVTTTATTVVPFRHHPSLLRRDHPPDIAMTITGNTLASYAYLQDGTVSRYLTSLMMACAELVPERDCTAFTLAMAMTRRRMKAAVLTRRKLHSRVRPIAALTGASEYTPLVFKHLALLQQHLSRRSCTTVVPMSHLRRNVN